VVEVMVENKYGISPNQDIVNIKRVGDGHQVIKLFNFQAN